MAGVEHAIRRRITEHKSTKRDWGDAQAITQALAREAELEEARRNSPEAVAARLFDGVELDEVEAGDPAALMRAATLASGRAMKGRLWAEARALAGLAESYARLAVRERSEARASGATPSWEEDPETAAWFDPDQLPAKRRELAIALGVAPDEAAADSPASGGGG